MGHIRNQKLGEKLAYSLLSSCGKCPECGHYLTIKADYKRAAKNFVVKKVCINRHFGCNYEEDISEDFNNALGLKANKNDFNYNSGNSLLKNRVNAYTTTGVLRNSITRDAHGKKNLFPFTLEPIVREFMEREMGDIKKCESCNEEFHFCLNQRKYGSKTSVYELVCPCCDATVDISDFIRYDSFLKGKIDRIDLLNFFNITSIDDCKIKWRYNGDISKRFCL